MKYYYYILILFFCSCSSENDIFKIKVNSDSQILNKKSNVFFEIFLNNELCKVEKLKLFINDIEVLEKTNLNGAKLGENIVKAQFNYDNQNKTIDLLEFHLLDYKV
jgi:hypothetical protein